MRHDLCIVLTARMSSERLPGKAMLDVCGKPLVYWIIRRLQTAGNVVLGITTEPEDDPLGALANAMSVPVVRHPKGDVIGTVDIGYRNCYPRARYIMRGLADMVWPVAEYIERACEVIGKFKGEAFAWALQPETLPVYGAREFPYAVSGWEKIVQYSTVKEHVDLYYHAHRDRFTTIYHVPPPPVMFRPYRTEVDYPEDIAMVREVAKSVSMLAPLEKIIKYLDSNSKIAQINRDRVEKTGPSLFTYSTKRDWFKDMDGKPIVGWKNELWTTPSDHSQPIFCRSGSCLLGLAEDGILFSPAGRFKSNAYLTCSCGSGLIWNS